MIIRRILNQVKDLIFDLNDIFPLIGSPLIYGWRILHNLKFIIGKKTLETNLQLKYSLERKNFNKIYSVKPNKIQYCLANKFNKWNKDSKILEGRWNRSKI
ncbi:hypothetical protein LCGC14_2685650, partial [marine sediment metagenome]